MKFHKSPIAKGLVFSAAGSMILFQASGFSLISADAQEKTSIQQELEKLYQQEGRQAPKMELKTLPNQTLDGRVFQDSAEPGQPPVAVSPNSQSPVRQSAPTTQSNATYESPQRRANSEIEQPAPRKRGLLHQFDKLMFWKKKGRDDAPVQQERVVETPQQNGTQSPRPQQPVYQPPAAPPAIPPVEADYPTTRFQRPVQNRPAPAQPRT